MFLEAMDPVTTGAKKAHHNELESFSLTQVLTSRSTETFHASSLKARIHELIALAPPTVGPAGCDDVSVYLASLPTTPTPPYG